MYFGKPLTVALALLTTAGLAGCGSASSAPSQPAGSPTVAVGQGEHDGDRHDTADVAFAQGMIPHHAQAVQMAALAPTRAGSDQVKRLAATIQAAQQPEIDQMKAMVTRWGAAVPDTGMPGMDHGPMPGMDHGTGHGAMPGMMSDADMTQLSQASGADFDRRFLTMMIAHHQGAVDMSATELANGRDPEAKALAQKISDAQRAEIAQMRQLLAGYTG